MDGYKKVWKFGWSGGARDGHGTCWQEHVKIKKRKRKKINLKRCVKKYRSVISMLKDLKVNKEVIRKVKELQGLNENAKLNKNVTKNKKHRQNHRNSCS